MVDALYLARDEDTLWAEWYRHLAERGLPPNRQLPRDVWRFRVGPLEVADLSDPSRLARVGLPSLVPGRRAWRPFQAVGERLWREGWPGLIAPSAARREGRVLCLYVGDNASPFTRATGPLVIDEPPAPPTGMRT